MFVFFLTPLGHHQNGLTFKPVVCVLKNAQKSKHQEAQLFRNVLQCRLQRGGGKVLRREGGAELHADKRSARGWHWGSVLGANPLE